MAKAINLLAVLCVFACLFLLASAFDQERMQAEKQGRLTQAQQCRTQRLKAVQPSQKIENEGGSIEMWEQDEDMFQCAGVAPFRYTIRANGLSIPHYHPSPRLLFVERGQGYISINFPGCPETFDSDSESESKESFKRGDSHQKVHRIQKGDIVAIPGGVAYWSFNDGTEDLVAVTVNDLNQNVNQLDHRFRTFYLGGGLAKQEQTRFTAGEAEKEEYFKNIMAHFDTELMAEALEIPVEVFRKIQEGEQTKKGFIVTARDGISMVKPDEYGRRMNGLEESTWCSMKVHQNMETREQSDVYSRQGGRLFVVNQNKLPLLRLLDMSAERGELFPNAIYSPSWNMNGHSVVYVTRGEAEVQIVDQSGKAVMKERVQKGDMFVVPQFFVVTGRAGKDGFKWVTFKTTSSPMRSPLAGYTSVIRAMPLQVVANSFRVSPSQAKDIKYNTGHQSLFLTPSKAAGF